MDNITKILVPIDFSDYTEQVVGLAADLSRRYAAPMQLLHAFEPMAYVRPEAYIVLGSDQIENILGSLRKELDNVAKSARALGALSVEAMVVQGHPASEILRYAKELHCDLIVMGTHGRTGLKHLLIGSVAENVVRTAHCAVLTLRALAKAV